MAEVVQGVVSHGLDTNVLFEKYTVEEIRGIEKKTRSDIERKKEELRMMVGERYRDLIEAADTITDMKHSSENVMQSINRMQELCQKMKQDHMVKGFNIVSKPRLDIAKRRDETQFYGIAVEIKLLLDMPEKIWSALDSRSYLLATRMYLLARHMHAGLQAYPGAQAARLLQCFPVLARTWSTISHFKDVILQACRDMLKVATISDEDAAESLCSLLLLEDSTPRQVFNDFLILSTTAVQQLFQGDQSGMSVKDQVCAVVRMIVHTLHQIYAVFYSDDRDASMKSNLLMSILAKVTDKGESGVILTDTNGASTIRFLPANVKDFRPVLRNHATPIAEKNLQENCLQWVKSCGQMVSAGLAQLLGYVGTVRGLASIRANVWEQLAQDARLVTWDAVCTATLRRQLNIWDEFFQRHFQERTKELLQSQYDGAVSTCKLQIIRVLTELSSPDKCAVVERDVSHYVWAEASTDIPTNMAWVTVGQKKLADGGTLSMKAKAYTPAVQSLCRGFDGRLRTLVEDAGHYLCPANMDTTGPFDLYADTPAVLAFLQESGGNCVTMLLEFLKGQLEGYRQQLSSSTDHAANIIILDRILLLGRLSGALCELSTHLQQCMLGTTEKVEQPRPGKRGPGVKGGVKYVEDPRWTEVKEKLHAFNNEAFGFWAEYTATYIGEKYRQALLDQRGSSILRCSTRWGEIEIEEETESGETMTSKIRVPTQASSYVTTLLYSLCEQINRVGGHTINKSVLRKLVQQLSDTCISTYEEVSMGKKLALVEEQLKGHMTINQMRALQLSFDLRLVTNLLPRKEDTAENKKYQQRVQGVIEALEGHVDPFDLDVFMPHMNTHISRQTQRFNVLLGALMSLDKHGSYLSTRPIQTSQAEQHNVLTLSSSQSRLPLLPLSVQNRSSMAPPIMQPPKSKSPTEATAAPPVVSMPHNESSGFLANMSTLWFSNVSKK